MPLYNNYPHANLTRTSMTNHVTNGDFSDGSTNWTAYSSTHAVSGGILSNTANGSNAYGDERTGLSFVSGHVFAIKLDARVTSSLCTRIEVYSLTGAFDVIVNTPTINVWQSISFIATTTTDINMTIRHVYANAATASGKVMEIKYVSVIDLTAPTAALGYQPTATQMDAWLLHYDPTNSWFDGTASIATNYVDGILTHDDWETFNNKVSLTGDQAITNKTVVLKAGAATAGTAPLKLTSGVDLTTAETGAIEYDGTNLHFTPTGALRESIHFGSNGSATLTAGTTTTITDATAKTTSTILLSPTSLATIALTPYVSTKSNGSFVITTLTAAGTETLDWVLVN